MGFLYPVVYSGDYLNFGRNSAWYQTGNIEVEVVIRIDSTVAQGPIISMSESDGATSTENPNYNIIWALELNTQQRPFYRHEYGNGTDWTTGSGSAPQLPFGVWKRVKFTRVGSTITILIDGVVVHTINYSNAPYAGPSPVQSLYIGRTYTGLTSSYDYGRGFCIAYAQYKGPTGNVLFTYGQDRVVLLVQSRLKSDLRDHLVLFQGHLLDPPKRKKRTWNWMDTKDFLYVRRNAPTGPLTKYPKERAEVVGPNRFRHRAPIRSKRPGRKRTRVNSRKGTERILKIVQMVSFGMVYNRLTRSATRDTGRRSIKFQ